MIIILSAESIVQLGCLQLVGRLPALPDLMQQPRNKESVHNARHTSGQKMPHHQNGCENISNIYIYIFIYLFVYLLIYLLYIYIYIYKRQYPARPAAVDGSDVLAPGHSLGKVMAPVASDIP